MEDRVILNRGVKTGVIAKRAFRAHFLRLHISFQDKIDIRRDIDIDCLAAHQLD